ncbi:MAG: RNA polymerase I enhancer binding protein [Thelocarpon impressellum]|nr:MAG: RNA polymerase I enhancer binding protein [Thelocarpon impressellum]
MGQQSSQLGLVEGHELDMSIDAPVTTSDPAYSGDLSPPAKSGKRKRSRRRRQRRDEEAVEQNKEEESARTLLEMKGDQGQVKSRVTVPIEPRSGDERGDGESQLHPGPDVVDVDVAREGEQTLPSSRKGKKAKRASKAASRTAGAEEPAAVPEETLGGLVYPEPYPSHASEQHRPLETARSALDPYGQPQQSYEDPSMYGDGAVNSPGHHYGSNGLYEGYQDPPPEYGERGDGARKGRKRRKSAHDVYTNGHTAAALANAASAANALIDPALTADTNEWQVSQSQGDADVAAEAPGHNTSSSAKKRKRRMPDVDVLVGWEMPHRPVKDTPPKITSKSRESNADYSEHELQLLTDHMDAYRTEHGMTWEEMNDRVQANAKGSKRDDFWTGVCAVLPGRPQGSVQKVCRRRFHNYDKRGKWDDEDDEALREAFAVHGKSWKRVGEQLGRMAEDCRDRYRNYIVCGDKRTVGEWTPGEEETLTTAVNECIELMREEASSKAAGAVAPAEADGEEPDWKKLISWSVVSDKMGKTRSRLQCQYKWKKLQARQKEAEAPQESENAPETGAGKEEAQVTWRTKKARQNIETWLPGDYYVLVKAIQDSGSTSEASIPWKIIGPEPWRSAWAAADRRIAFATIKARVPGSEELPLQDVVERLMRGLEEERPTELQACCDRTVLPPTKRSRKRKKLSESRVGAYDEDWAGQLQQAASREEEAWSEAEQLRRLNQPIEAFALGDEGYAERGHDGAGEGDVDGEMALQVQLLRDA